MSFAQMLTQLHSTRDLQMLEVGSIYKGPGRAIVQESNPHDAQLLQQVGTPLCFALA